MNHIGEDAELYALGMLDGSHARRLLEHVSSCDPCRRLVEDATHVVASLGVQAPQHDPSPALRSRLMESAKGSPRPRAQTWSWFAAGIAAGVAAAALVLAPLRMNQEGFSMQSDLALSTIVRSHFSHVQFQAAAPSAPQGKVLYGRRGEWLYVVVHAPAAGTEVAIETGAMRKTLGALEFSGGNGALFISKPGHFKTVELISGGKVVARATPIFAR